MRKLQSNNANPNIVAVKRQTLRHLGRKKAAQRYLAEDYAAQSDYAAAIEDALDEVTSSRRLRISRWVEAISLLLLGIAEIAVAQNVVQAVGLTANATRLVAIAVGATATALAWLAGHEWATARDPEEVVAGRRGWLKLAVVACIAFILANLGVRIYYGVLENEVHRYASGLTAPVLSGLLLTTVTAALMIVAAFISAHAETASEADLRARLRRVRRVLRSLERAGVAKIGTSRGGLRSVSNEEAPPAA